MEIDFGTIPSLVGLAVVLFVIYFSLYFKFIYSVIDPLFTFVLTTSFASVLAIQVIPTTVDMVQFFGCQFAVWIGFAWAYAKREVVSAPNQVELTTYFSEQNLLRITTYCLLVAYVISNIIVGFNKGFAFLSDTPTESKIANFQQGFGLFRKINWSMGAFTATGLMFMLLTKPRILDIFLLGIVIVFTALEGSKSALLSIAITAGIVFYHPIFAERQQTLKKIRRYIPFLIIGIMGIFFAILLKENEGIDGAFIAFIRRLLFSADSILFFYQPVNLDYFEQFSFGDFLVRIVNPVLGFFRLQPYQEAPGNIMVDNLRPPGSVAGVTVGPNAPFYIESRIYFNYWLGFLYCALVGYLYASLRVYYFSIRRVSAFYFVFMGSFLRIAGAMLIDMNLAVTQLFDLLFFVLIPYKLLSFLLTNRIRIRLSGNWSRLVRRIRPA